MITRFVCSQMIAIVVASFFVLATGCVAADSTKVAAPEVEKANPQSPSGAESKPARPVEATLRQMAEASKSMFTAQQAEMMAKGAADLAATDPVAKAMKVGDTMPAFVLPNQDGLMLSSAELVKESPLVVVFYRGEWCPYCNVYLRGLQTALPEIAAAGGRVIAISGESPENTESVASAGELKFHVLSDTGLVVARKFGVVYEMPPALNQVYVSFGLDLKSYYKAPKAELPISATYVIDKTGVIRYAHVELDYKLRAEPADIVAELKKLI